MSLSILCKTGFRLQQLRRADRWSRAQLENYQHGALRDLRGYVYAHSPFYRKFHKGLEGRELSELPIMTKGLLMDNFEEAVTVPGIQLKDAEAHLSISAGAKFRDRYVVNASGGSTGQRGIFISDPSECAGFLASLLRPSAWAGFKPNPFHRARSANVASSLPWHMSNTVFALLGETFVRRLQLDVSSPLTEILAQLQAFDPEWLGAYASFARILAREQLEGRLRIAPKGIAVHSEVLTSETRQLLESVWGKVVFNVYSTTETAVLAAECAHHEGLHLLEDLTLTEVVDHRGAPVPPGEYGEKVLVTVLGRRTQPLIRYELSDMIRLRAQPCRCGRPFRLVDDIQGRLEEVIYLPSATGGRVAIQPLVFDRILDTLPVKAWQVVQDGESINVLLVGLRPDFEQDTIVEQLRKHLGEQGASVSNIRIDRVPEIPRSVSGKTPLIRTNSRADSARST